MSNIANTNLHLNSSALAVLQLLSDSEPSFAPYTDKEYQYSCITAAWYNGRERGISLSIRKSRDLAVDIASPHLYICFAEYRSSDEIVIYSWTGPLLENPPTPNDLPEDAWTKGRKIIQSLRVDLAFDAICEIITNFYKNG